MPEPTDQTCVLAYSGGLDTSFCIPYLTERGYAVHAVAVNTGGFSESEVEQMRARALQLGAAGFECVDASETYYRKCIRYLVYGNVLRGNVYPLCVSSERAFQAMAVLEAVRRHGAGYVAHGSTGAGNDQVRFDLVFQSLAPEVEIITPIRDDGLSREAELAFLAERGFTWAAEKKTYSVNQGLWGTSVGGAETLTSHAPLPDGAYPTPLSQNRPRALAIGFERGEVATIDGEALAPVALIQRLQALAQPYGIGRDTHVGDTIIGIKGRVGFEAAAAVLITKAHELLEKHTLAKWQAYWKRQLGEWYGMALHEGQYLDPSMRDIEGFLESTQRHVTGTVHLTLHPRTFSLDGVDSPNDLMNSAFGTYGEENTAWTAADVKGFTKVLANPHAIYYAQHPDEL